MQNIKRLKLACYTTSISMSIVANISPLLFLTLHELFGVSFTFLGFLVLINYSTQLTADLIFSFFSKKFNIPIVIKFMPFITICGLLTFALLPLLIPQMSQVGFVLGTVIFSAACGLGEALTSPIIAALPSDNPEREMSKFHSIYAWGVVAVVIVATVFLLLFGEKNWWLLVLLFIPVPLVSALLFLGADIPDIQNGNGSTAAPSALKTKEMWLCFFAIFLGGAIECTMAQWSSAYIENALGIPKLWGDIFGVAMFAVALGLGRTLYARFGRKIESVLLFGAVGASACYLLAAISSQPILGLAGCALTGLFSSMMWPGCLTVAAKRVPNPNVVVYAMMAAGGDLGASLVPQLAGFVTDSVSASAWSTELATKLEMLPDQLGMKVGMLIGMIFPIIAVILYAYIMKTRKKYSE